MEKIKGIKSVSVKRKKNVVARKGRVLKITPLKMVKTHFTVLGKTISVPPDYPIHPALKDAIEYLKTKRYKVQYRIHKPEASFV